MAAERKIFVLNSKGGKICTTLGLTNMMQNRGLKLGKDIDIRTSEDPKEFQRRLPRGYDVYLIHPSDTSEEALAELREKEPWSEILCISGYYAKFSRDFFDLFNRKYDNLDDREVAKALGL